MAKEYFQDITPPQSSSPTPSTPQRNAPIPQVPPENDRPAPPPSERTIRNIPIMSRPRADSPDIRNISPPGAPPRTPKPTRRFWLWGIAGLSIAILATIALIALRPTVVTVTPRSHTVVFDQTAHFTAYPAATAASGTLPYTLLTSDVEDSDVVAAQGVEHVSEPASGVIVVYNEFSASAVKLVKNTRFASQDGHIFRIPAEAVVPGMKGGVPGQISLTVFADQPGDAYNVPPGRFTIPGLASNAAMYAKVYARSSTAMAGGFSGDRPKIPNGGLDAAIAAVRARLEQKAQSALQSPPQGTIAVPGLVRITYQSLPPTTESGGNVRIHERAHVEVPVFPADTFAKTIAQSVSADAEQGMILKPLQNFAASASGTTPIDNAPLDFTLSGHAQLVWDVDTQALAAALAGKSDSAFQTIVNGFPGVAEAHARIEPFWKNTFPNNPTAIKIRIAEPAGNTGS